MNTKIQQFFHDKILEAAVEFGDDFSIGDLSDGHHTFNELYEFRKIYNAALFTAWGKYSKPVYLFADGPNGKTPYIANHSPAKYDAHKSLKHDDGQFCFDSNGKWFIVVAMLPGGQISNHYPIEDWDLFKVPIHEKVKWTYDGHTAKDVLDRIKDVILNHR